VRFEPSISLVPLLMSAASSICAISLATSVLDFKFDFERDLERETLLGTLERVFRAERVKERRLGEDGSGSRGADVGPEAEVLLRGCCRESVDWRGWGEEIEEAREVRDELFEVGEMLSGIEERVATSSAP